MKIYEVKPPINKDDIISIHLVKYPIDSDFKFITNYEEPNI